MKKVLSVCLCVLLVFVCCLPCFAANAVSAKVDTVLSDGTLTVTVSVPANSGIATFESTLQYDKEKLELTDVQFGAGDVTTKNTDASGAVKLFMIWQETQTEAATLVTVTFKVKEGAAGTTDITFVNTAATDGSDAAMDISYGESNTFAVVLSDTPDTNEKIPSTAGKYAAVGGVGVVALAVAVTAGALVKRKKSAE